VNLRRRPVLDGLHVRDFLADPDKGVERIAEFVGILEDDHRQVGRIRNHLNMGDTHFRTMLNAAHAQRTRWEAQQGGRAMRVGHFRDAGGFVAAVGVDAADQRHAVADFVAGLVHHPGLFVHGAGVHLGGMSVDGHRGNAIDIRRKGEVAAGFGPVEFVVRVERGKRRRDYTLGDVVFETGHIEILC
jgi:hypothetical protein